MNCGNLELKRVGILVAESKQIHRIGYRNGQVLPVGHLRSDIGISYSSADTCAVEVGQEVHLPIYLCYREKNFLELSTGNVGSGRIDWAHGSRYTVLQIQALTPADHLLPYPQIKKTFTQLKQAVAEKI
ncbi:hypothetical protein SAMN05660330_01500 [Desulforhopalus singaporensis]|uniref:Uncharacterized protein n=1 Tax=Desulforhopalus singaporensis TaxID=91360 RepID=A0A1H0NY43_9BACT|nr:hypothetical protein SAMN05660330_01500 [Desulforhopalus singaporensis]